MAELVSKTWCPDENECWELLNVKSHDVETGEVEVFGDEDARVKRFKATEVHTFDASHVQDLENISDMNNVHEGPLLDLLRRRYREDKIYTFTGDILISINPYKNIGALYELPDSAPEIDSTATPHLFTVASRALAALQEAPLEEQTIIINGESGAGKTEASKYIIRLLGHLSASEGASFAKIQDQIIETNLLLEEFGNAKTVRNDNSSRFGKYIRLEYQGTSSDDPTPARLGGAHISYFLLETSRLVSRSDRERNYHVFYAMCNGASPEEREVLGLGEASSYKYLFSPKLAKHGYEIAGRDENAVWKELKRTLKTIGLSEPDMFDVFRALTTILALGNIEVGELHREVSEDEEVHNVCVAQIDENQDALTTVCEHLGLDMDVLRKSLSSRVVVSNSARSSMQRVELSKAQTQDSINALAKAIYMRLFDWLLLCINQQLAGSAECLSAGSVAGEGCIGILDIYGFEILERNSFEQLCINYANECLQRQFNSEVFGSEQQRYQVEGVQWKIEEFGVDNQPCIDLIGKAQLGIFSILDEQTLMLYHATGISSGNQQAVQDVEDQLLRKLHTAHANKHPNYVKPRIAGTMFKIRHFAGLVEYDVTNFPRKNTDAMHSDMIMLMNNSSNEFVRMLFRRDVEILCRDQTEKEAGAARRNFTTNDMRSENAELAGKLGRRRAPGDPLAKDEDCKDAEQAPGSGSADRGESDLQQQSDWSHHRHTASAAENLFSPEGIQAIIAAASEKEAKRTGKPALNRMQSTRAFAARKTVSSRFRQQLKCLMSILNAAKPHYIRCIKPNNGKQANTFASPLVLEQLRYIGVLETVRIRKTGYPVRFKYGDFTRMYETLLKECGLDELSEEDRGTGAGGKISSPLRNVIRKTLETFLPADKWQLGNTSVFLKDHQNDELNDCIRRIELARAASAATKLQGFRRMLKCVRAKRKRLGNLARMQAVVRARQERARFLEDRHKVVNLQKWARKIAAAKREACAGRMAAVVRMFLAKRLAKRERIRQRTERAQKEASIKMQACVRGYLTRTTCCNFKVWKRAANRLQLAMRTTWRNRTLQLRADQIHESAMQGQLDDLKATCQAAVEQGWGLEGLQWHRQNLQTLLHAAVKSGNLQVVQFVLDPESSGFKVQGSSIFDATDKDGNSALHTAVALPENANVISHYLVDHASQQQLSIAGVEEGSVGETDVDTAEEPPSNPQELRDFLQKKKVHSIFLKRHVVLETSKGTLSYFKTKRDAKPRCEMNLGKEVGTSLKVSDRYKNCFEISSPELLSAKCKTGTIYFRCKNHQELQRWISALREIEGVGFTSALSSLDSIDRTSWAQMQSLLQRKNAKRQTALHVAAKNDLDLTLWLLALLSYQGPLAMTSNLQLLDADDCTPAQCATQSHRLDIAKGLEHLSKQMVCAGANGVSGDAPVTGSRMSITQQTLNNSGTSGGTFLSLFFGDMFIPEAQAIEQPVLFVSVVNESPSVNALSASQSNMDDVENGSRPIRSGFRSDDIVEPAVRLTPMMRKDKEGNAILRFGMMWHMQTPLEQLSSTATILIQLKYGKSQRTVKSSLRLPFNTRTIGVGALTPGAHKMAPAPSTRNPNAILRAINNVANVTQLNRLIPGEKPSSKAAAESREEVRVKVHYSLRSAPCTNCF
ncbi:Unconventional myosin-IXb (Unconventional myosin-9b) [Durusdinium trenchii]|uniref:Unconventional myosin-IXb (Unconventional myosin-9b) n=1 Tax=Durusdinium trenchii TaxID=1381693 RepID=A0ABP0IHY7_9DINO